MRTDILTRVSEQTDHLSVILQEIRKDGLPLVLLGAGTLGAYFCNLLTNCGIAIAQIATHRKYWKTGMCMGGKAVIPIEDAIAKYPSVNVFCALQYLQATARIESELLATGRVHQVFTYDTGCIHWGPRSLTHEFLVQHQSAFTWLYEHVADQRSRDTLIAYLNQRISGKPGYLNHVYDHHHLFPPDIIQLAHDECFLDCGAFDGASILSFAKAMHALHFEVSEPIYAMEPDKRNLKKIEANCSHLPTLCLVPFGAWSKRETLRFADESSATSRIADAGATTIEVDTIDHIMKDRLLSYIKMDIEGAEMQALQGAEQTIINQHPKLGICVYHKPDDLVRIPRYIASFSHQYQLFLRAHSWGANDLLLYAV